MSPSHKAYFRLALGFFRIRLGRRDMNGVVKSKVIMIFSM